MINVGNDSTISYMFATKDSAFGFVYVIHILICLGREATTSRWWLHVIEFGKRCCAGKSLTRQCREVSSTTTITTTTSSSGSRSWKIRRNLPSLHTASKTPDL